MSPDCALLGARQFFWDALSDTRFILKCCLISWSESLFQTQRCCNYLVWLFSLLCETLAQRLVFTEVARFKCVTMETQKSGKS